MSLLDGPESAGATPLTPEDLEGLLLTWVTTRADLNRVEQTNIETAILWAFLGRRPVSRVEDLLTPRFSDRLHQKMFDDVWEWAGKRRRRQTNIGVDPFEIATGMKNVFDDAIFWHVNDVCAPAELAVRIHHRLVCVHPYPNGNGRHTRLMADLYLHITGRARLTWGGGVPLGSPGVNRARYIEALLAANDGDMQPLLTFANT